MDARQSLVKAALDAVDALLSDDPRVKARAVEQLRDALDAHRESGRDRVRRSRKNRKDRNV